MPSIHSKFNQNKTETFYGIPNLPIRKKSSAILDPKKLVNPNDNSFDIIDEAILYFRVNIFFKNFPIDGPADKLIVYLTVFIQKILEKAMLADEKKAKDNIKALVDGCEYVRRIENFFNQLVTVTTPNEENSLKKYLKDLRSETVDRMLNILYENPETKMDKKYWAALGKKKFLGYDMPVASK